MIPWRGHQRTLRYKFLIHVRFATFAGRVTHPSVVFRTFLCHAVKRSDLGAAVVSRVYCRERDNRGVVHLANNKHIGEYISREAAYEPSSGCRSSSNRGCCPHSHNYSCDDTNIVAAKQNTLGCRESCNHHAMRPCLPLVCDTYRRLSPRRRSRVARVMIGGTMCLVEDQLCIVAQRRRLLVALGCPQRLLFARI